MKKSRPKSRLGRHQSTSKEGKVALDFIRSLPGVRAVTLGRSQGGKSLGGSVAVGHVKLQRREVNGFKAVLQSSKGLQEFFISIEPAQVDEVKKVIEKRF